MGGGHPASIQFHSFKSPPTTSEVIKVIKEKYPGHAEFDFVPDTLRDLAFILQQEGEGSQCAASEVADMLNHAFKTTALRSGAFTLGMHYSEWEDNDLYDAVVGFFTEDSNATGLISNDHSNEYLVLYDRPQLLAAWQKITRLLDTSRDGEDVIKVMEFVMDAVARGHGMACSLSNPP